MPRHVIEGNGTPRNPYGGLACLLERIKTSLDIYVMSDVFGQYYLALPFISDLVDTDAGDIRFNYRFDLSKRGKTTKIGTFDIMSMIKIIHSTNGAPTPWERHFMQYVIKI